jgi:hypothetical protein
LFFCCVTVGEGYWSIKKTFFYSPVRANACHACRADIQAPRIRLVLRRVAELNVQFI